MKKLRVEITNTRTNLSSHRAGFWPGSSVFPAKCHHFQMRKPEPQKDRALDVYMRKEGRSQADNLNYHPRKVTKREQSNQDQAE